MKSEVLLALLNKIVDERLESLASNPIRRGPRGYIGPRGLDGKDFNLSEHSETIKSWTQEFALKFEDLSESQIGALRGPRGRDGVDGVNGKDFDFSQYEQTIKNWVQEFALKFEDLTAEQLEALRGRTGRDGKDGSDGKDFDFQENLAEISKELHSIVNGIQGKLKLKFNDLSVDDIEQLRGPRGRDGRDGDNFVFEDHREFFNSLRPKFSDFTGEERETLRLHFADLTQEEKSQLKLRFEDLSDEDRQKIRGARGSRGQRGPQGIEGKEGQAGPRGIRGLPGPHGITGRSGSNGTDGRDGLNGQDAPYITEISVDQIRSDRIEFVFEFSDGSKITSNIVDLPAATNVYIAGGGFSSSSGTGGGGGADGKSAYEIAVENGFVGTEEDWLESLVGPTGAAGLDGKSAYELALDSGFVGTEEEWLESLVGPEGPEGPQGTPGTGGGSSFSADCDPSVFVGAFVRLTQDSPVESVMSDWPTMLDILQINYSEYGTVAVNAQADNYENSNTVGVVTSKPTSTTCEIQSSGETPSMYYSLDVDQDYYLSAKYPGRIVAIFDTPTDPGEVLLKIGKATAPGKLLVSVGKRMLL